MFPAQKYFMAVISKYSLDCLTLSWRRPLSYRNQSIDLLWKWAGFYMITTPVMKELTKKILNIIFIATIWDYTFLYREPKSAPSSQSCLYFQDFQDWKLLNGCVVFLQNKQILNVFQWFFIIRHCHTVSRISKQFLWSS